MRCYKSRILVTVLDGRDRLVVEARFGLGGEPRAHRFREIAERLDLSTERVRQLFVRSLDRLRNLANVEPFDIG